MTKTKAVFLHYILLISLLIHKFQHLHHRHKKIRLIGVNFGSELHYHTAELGPI